MKVELRSWNDRAFGMKRSILLLVEKCESFVDGLHIHVSPGQIKRLLRVYGDVVLMDKKYDSVVTLVCNGVAYDTRLAHPRHRNRHARTLAELVEKGAQE